MGSAVLAAISPELIVAVVLAVIGGAVGCLFGLRLLDGSRRQKAHQKASAIIEESQREAERLIKSAKIDAKDEFLKRKEQFETESQETRTGLREFEKRLEKREDNLERKLDTLLTKEKSLEATAKDLAKRQREVSARSQELEALYKEQRDQLIRISGMSVEEGKRLLLRNLEREAELEAVTLIERRLTEARDTAESKAREIVITAIQRYAADQTCDSTVSTVEIPSDDMKGRVIGREGRNIRAFEKATGVDVIVDDTPGVVVVSAFDPIRREVARQALEKLIQDGRIHPARIEELVQNTRQQVEKQVMEIGKKAMMEANVGGLHRKQIDLLGRLSFRTSYGQNVLRHSIEVAYLCQVMADELGLDGKLARRCGLLHDIGKAVDHEVEGGHPQIGADICKRFDERSEVLNAVAGHHGDVESTSPYTPLVASADAVSAARPGGRRESLDRYIKRLEQLEEIATAFAGVREAYAIQAGREVRVIVDANRMDDQVARKTARDIAKRIEEDTSYPGEVKVTLLRETRAVEYAR